MYAVVLASAGKRGRRRQLMGDKCVACMRADVRYVHQQAIIDVFAGTHDASVEVVNDVNLKNTGRVRVLPFLHCFQGRSLVRIVG